MAETHELGGSTIVVYRATPKFREMGYLPQTMVNYLALLGWGDGTENEFFTLEQLVEKFTIERVNKSGTIFDSTKLRWMNGQHLRSLPQKELTKLIGELILGKKM